MIGSARLASLDRRESAFGALLVTRDFSGDEDFERLAGMGKGRSEGGTVVADPRAMTIEFPEIGFDHHPAYGLG